MENTNLKGLVVEGQPQGLSNKIVTYDGLIDFLEMLKDEIPRMGSGNELLTGTSIYSYAFGQENINKGTYSTLIGCKNQLNEYAQFVFVMGNENGKDAPIAGKNIFVLGNTNNIQKSESCYIFGHGNSCGNLGTTNDVYIFGKNLTCYNSTKRAQPLYLLGQYAQRDSNSGWGYPNMAIVIGGGTSSTDQGRKTVFALDYNGNISTPLTIGENSDKICVSFSPQEHVIEFHDVPTFLNGATFNAGTITFKNASSVAFNGTIGYATDSNTTFSGAVEYISGSSVKFGGTTSFSANAQFDANIILGGTNDEDSKIQDNLYQENNLAKYIYYSHGLRHLLHPVFNNQAYWNVRDNQNNDQETTLHINLDNARDKDDWVFGDWDQDGHYQKAYAPQNIHFHAGAMDSWANIECGSIHTHNQKIECGAIISTSIKCNPGVTIDGTGIMTKRLSLEDLTNGVQLKNFVYNDFVDSQTPHNPGVYVIQAEITAKEQDGAYKIYSTSYGIIPIDDTVQLTRKTSLSILNSTNELRAIVSPLDGKFRIEQIEQLKYNTNGTHTTKWEKFVSAENITNVSFFCIPLFVQEGTE